MDGEKIYTGARMLDAAAIIKDAIPLDEWRRTSPELRAAKLAMQPEADRIRRRYVKQTIARLKTEGFDLKPKTIDDAVLRRVLASDFVLYPNGKPPLTVAELLADPETWDREHFADPLEPDYADDPRIATAMLSGGKSCIYSYAHGGQTYALGTPFRAIEGGRRDGDGSPAGDNAGGWQCGSDGTVLLNEHNFKRALELEGVTLRHNEFAHEDEILGFPGHGRQLTDIAEISLRLEIWKKHKLKFGKQDFRDFVAAAAFRNRVHPVRQYLDEAMESWDREPRIDKWLHTYLGAEDNEVNSFIGRAFLTAAVRRVRYPGCKFDYLVILESLQGEKKSWVFRALCPDESWFTDNLTLSASTKETMEVMSGVWIAEISELSGMHRRDVEHVKAFLARQSDRARMAYGHRGEHRPRQFVLAGTTNADDYLLDTTGNRRFWPVKCGRVDIAKIEHDRDLLWGEAAYRETRGEKIYPPDSLVKKLQREQTDRQTVDVWDGPVEEWLNSFAEGKAREKCALLDVAVGAVGKAKDEITPMDEKRLVGCMKRGGWIPYRSDGKRLWKPDPSV